MTPSLPTELLEKIFRYATYAGVDVDLAATHPEFESFTFAKFEKDNLDTMATKIVLTRVSRRFRWIALEFLYEFVRINKSKQAIKLVKMMKRRSSNAGLGPREWIKFLFVRCSIGRRMTKILQLCRGLRGISWNPTTFQRMIQNWEAVQDEMIQNIPTNIRFLHWDGTVLFRNIAAFLQQASASLQILYISGFLVDRNLQRPISHALYPSLTHLHVQQMFDFDWLDSVTWEMPSLIELKISAQYYGGYFLRVFRAGKSLRVVRLGQFVTLFPQLLSHILETCPNLEEIYYHYISFSRSSLWESDASHMKLKKVGLTIVLKMYMDIDLAYSEFRNNFGTITKTRFPLLDTVVIDAVLGSGSPKDTKLLMTRVSEDFFSAEITVI